MRKHLKYSIFINSCLTCQSIITIIEKKLKNPSNIEYKNKIVKLFPSNKKLEIIIMQIKKIN
jgi:hypothetical protein